MAMPPLPPSDIVLTCTPEKVDDRVVLAYAVANNSQAAVYVMDAIVGTDPKTRAPVPNRDQVTIWLGRDSYAHVLNGLALLPTDRNVRVRVIPVALRLEPGATLKRTIELREPLAEVSPYFGPGPVGDYRVLPIEGLALHVDVLSANAAGLRVEPVAVSPEHKRVGADNLGAALRRLTVTFRAKGLHLMVRTGAYPRPD
mgnify:CR=1 FL=1